ncbi:MAG: GatB/YqeY domain-containing protein [Candidatus Omnitrophica bacterium]|nr:GatB/YqeY domain-containing protein [Candidatus Omnitrophota bacterium]
MNLCEKIEDDVKRAMKAGDSMKVSVLRMVLSAVRMLQIEKNVKTLEDDSVAQILQKQVKQHRESIEQFTKGARGDLADKEKAELKILEEYLPKQFTTDELMVIVKAAVSETGAIAKSDMGKVMKIVTEKTKGRADGKTVSQMVGQFLK